MSEIIPDYSSEALDLIKNIDKYGPYLNGIYLFSTYITGTTYIENIKDLNSSLIEGLEVYFFRELENQYDNRAIVIKDGENNKIGYIPKYKNDIISKLMDSGKIIFGKIIKKEWKNNYLRIDFDVYFKD